MVNFSVSPTHHDERSSVLHRSRFRGSILTLLNWFVVGLIGITVLSQPNAPAINIATTASSSPNARAIELQTAANDLKRQWRKGALLAAIANYEEASKLFADEGWRNESALCLMNAGELYFFLSDYSKSIDSYERAGVLYQSAHNEKGRSQVLARIGLVNIYLGQAKKGLTLCRDAINTFNRSVEASHSAAQAEAYNCVGEASYSLGQLRESIEILQQALSLWTELKNNDGIALAQLNLGYARSDMGDNDQAQKDYSEALAFFRGSGNKRGEALALTILGTIHSFNGDNQAALDTHQQAMSLFQTVGDLAGEGIVLNSIGKTYEDLNKLDTALDNYNKALAIFQQRGNIDFQSVTNYYLGRTYNRMGNQDEALKFLYLSVTQSEETGTKRVTAYALSTISGIRSNQGFPTEAITQLQTVIRLYQALGDRRGRANALNELGRIHMQRGNHDAALSNYTIARDLYRSAADKTGEAESLYLMAVAENKLGWLDKALRHIKESNEAIESLRSEIISFELRASYFASVHKQSELLIELLMERYRRGDSLSSLLEAFNASEKAHSRSLLEGLGENTLKIRKGADPLLLDKERSLQKKLRGKSLYQMKLLGADSPDLTQLAQVRKEIRELTTACDAVQSEIKQKSSAYATLVQPEPLTLQEVQSSINDPDTLLLQYSIGTTKSYLFALTSNTLNAFELPGRVQLEGQVRGVIRLLIARETITDTDVKSFNAKAAIADDQYWIESQKLSKTLLGPVAGLAAKKRLLIVADGLLHHLPFEALPGPESQKPGGPRPLLVDNEIVNLPSASTLAAIRKQTTSAIADPTKLLAVIADPVFSSNDARFSGQTTQKDASESTKPQKASYQGGDQSANVEPIRLPATKREAEMIIAAAPPGATKLAIGFEANRAFVAGGELAPYRVVHFATHGFVDDENPDVSGIFLSMLNPQGQTEEGFLPLNEIYNLDLENTQLVVLSACQSAIGKELYGEGLVSLGRGFMYAGCKSVVASLWKVDDEATSKLMSDFYTGLFEEGLTPAAALRRAKLAMLQDERFRAPFYWASFVLQGEYRDTIASPKQSRSSLSFKVLAVVGLVLLGALSLYAFRRVFRRKHPPSRP